MEKPIDAFNHIVLYEVYLAPNFRQLFKLTSYIIKKICHLRGRQLLQRHRRFKQRCSRYFESFIVLVAEECLVVRMDFKLLN